MERNNYKDASEVEPANRIHELTRLTAFPGYGDRTATTVDWTTKDGSRMRAVARRDGYLDVRWCEDGRPAEHGIRVNAPFILSMWPSAELAAERAEYADLDEAGELDELADEIEEAWA